MALPRTERPRGPQGPRSLAAAAASDPGRERGNNEDRVLAAPDLGIFAVIDGVGGESAGEVAADIALEVLQARLSRRTTDLGRLVREAIALANRQIYERAKNDPHLAGMACVLTVAVLDSERDGRLDGHQATVGHVGDSRLYALKAGEIRKVTPDHSPVGAREDAGELSEEEAMHHPRRNEIFRDVGSAPHEPDEKDWIDVLEVPFPADSALLLCSDGLSDMISSREILETVEESVVSVHAADTTDIADLAVHALIERANRAGGRDNVSAVLVLGDRFAEAVRQRRDGGGKRGKSGRSGRKAETTAAERTPERTPERTGARAAEKAPRKAPGRLAERSTDQALDRTLDRPLLRGAGRARLGLGERLAEIFTGRAAKVLLILALLAGAAGASYLYRQPLEEVLGLGGGAGSGGTRDVLVVGIGDGGLASIGEALAQARPGQKIEVAPGEYHERIALKDGVAIVSRTPGGAVLLPPGEISAAAATPATPATSPPLATPATPAQRAAPAVSAKGVRGARLSGFKVLGSAAAPWSVGVRLDGSEVELDSVEVTGTTGPGVEIRGADRSTLRLSYIHGNGGPGILVTGNAAPRLQGNLIAGNGARPGALAPGVEVREKAVPLLNENRIESNGGGGVTLPGPERGEEIFRWNNFGTVPREQAVRALAAPAGPAASAGNAGNASGTAAKLPAPQPGAVPAKPAPRSRP